MPASPTGPSPGEGGYIRGGGGVEINTRRVIGAVAAVCVAGLVALVAGLTISAVHQNTEIRALRNQGVPVEVTVTGCLAIGSGVGMGVEYWQCRGSYALGGHRYDEVVRGSRTLLEAGQRIQAVAVPGQPSLVSTVPAVGTPRSAWTAYIAPAVLSVISVVGVLGWVLLGRRRRRSEAGAESLAAAPAERAGSGPAGGRGMSRARP